MILSRTIAETAIMLGQPKILAHALKSYTPPNDCYQLWCLRVMKRVAKGDPVGLKLVDVLATRPQKVEYWLGVLNAVIDKGRVKEALCGMKLFKSTPEDRSTIVSYCRLNRGDTYNQDHDQMVADFVDNNTFNLKDNLDVVRQKAMGPDCANLIPHLCHYTLFSYLLLSPMPLTHQALARCYIKRSPNPLTDEAAANTAMVLFTEEMHPDFLRMIVRELPMAFVKSVNLVVKEIFDQSGVVFVRRATTAQEALTLMEQYVQKQAPAWKLAMQEAAAETSKKELLEHIQTTPSPVKSRKL